MINRPGNRFRLGLGSLLLAVVIFAALAVGGALQVRTNPFGWVLLIAGVILAAMMIRAVYLWKRLRPELESGGHSASETSA